MGTKKLLSFAALLLVMAMALVFAGGCADDQEFRYDGEPILADPEYVRTPPPVKLAEYVGTQQVYNDDGYATGLIDYTNADQGYVAVQMTAPTKSRVKVIYRAEAGEIEESFHLQPDGEIYFIPLAYGTGTYVIQLLYHDGGAGNSFYTIASAEVTARIANEYTPFTVQGLEVNYSADSEAVKFSHELTKNCSTDIEVVRMIYWWVSDNIIYDDAKADSVLTTKDGDFTPDPDTTLRLKTGICYDYASLTAAMLRANGIPCRLVKGYVKQGDGEVYHAWNHIWLRGVGLIAVKIQVNPNDWTRIDATFSAAGTSQAQFIGDGTNYTDWFYH